jgi:PiT family inorganic phosphate transporter
MTLLYVIIALALIFDFINGFHDAANSIATVVSTKVLSPFTAVLWAAFFNFIAFLFFGLHVATTIAKDIVSPETITLTVILATLISSIVWNLLTWWWGLPSSSSHALVGGLVGATIAHAGFGSILGAGFSKILIFIIIAPMLGFFLAYLISILVIFFARNSTPSKVDKKFRKLQLLSAAAYSLGHGGNDAQKSMGIIAVALILGGQLDKDYTAEQFPFWVVMSCQVAMAMGTMFGGWRIVKTMGQKITKLRPFEGFCAESAGAVTLFVTVIFGIPVSTTHTITGAIVGVGARQRLSAVRWGVAGNIVWAWILTIPISGLIGYLTYLLSMRLGLH